MKTIKNLKRLHRFHKLIQDETTGSPKELARRLRISERLVYLMVEQLKDYNAKVCYNRSRKTYYYKEYFNLEVTIAVSVHNNEERTDLHFG